MCFSPQGDVVAGLVVTAIGIGAVRQLRHRHDHVALAVFPVLLGLHQIDEAFVWWSLQGHVSQGVGRVAMWIYLLIAFVVLPTLVPIVAMLLEPTKRRRWRIAPFLPIGLVVSVVSLVTMLRHAPSAALGSYHLVYSVGLPHGLLVVGLYIVATCGSLLASSYRHIRWFGVANLAAVVVLALLAANGFASLWCFYAAIASAAILLHMRYAKPHRAAPYVLS